MLYAEKAMYEAFRRTKLFFLHPFSWRKLFELSLAGFLGGVLQQAGASCGSGYNGGSTSGSGGG
ncbi:MAG: hypothetical protein ABRQ38_00185 [Candidatus Eremiobacterota bacterium]